ncbi:MAG: Protease Do [Candidatus Woesebacteria bacterium GW2011_GWA1_39_21]|uniref:Protease Do n=1 Tax=Candidatus Woesebacteria bacterium GW2011_GWA1_39_21 TaxID=1618550 RepID=A0A0G0N916_9BACT|nr:MAG: Protease Do [Candidatus Woesebacteria bacterium GW2011_GWA1_39_21]
MKSKLKGVLILIVVVVILSTAAVGGAVADRVLNIKVFDAIITRINPLKTSINSGTTKVVYEESIVVDVAKKVSPSVVTVSVQTPQRRVLQFNPFGGGFSQSIQGGKPQDIGTGFIVASDGLIVTNKHVVSDTTATYQVITSNEKTYDVINIARDPSNDIAVLKIDASSLQPVEMGDSSNLEVGQFVVAIGTALGEFRNTVTQGVVSGLGRGITAGDQYQGYVEQLDNVIQTDAAINPGNSGGPLLNSSGQVIGINVAVASGAQNVGFAIPINIVKDALAQYNQNGAFIGKAYLGVEYQMVSKQAAVLNDVPEGAYVVNVVSGSPAADSGLKVDDIITKMDGKALNANTTLADVIKTKKPGDEVSLEVYRDGNTMTVRATLGSSES